MGIELSGNKPLFLITDIKSVLYQISEWLIKEMKKGDKIAIDPSVHAQSEVKRLKDEFSVSVVCFC